MSSKTKKRIFLAALLIIPGCFLIYCGNGNSQFSTLPYVGPKILDYKEVNGKMVVDTIYHSIPDFEFYNQDSTLFSSDQLNGKVYVADFFFTACGTICPKMTENMRQMAWRLDKEALKDKVGFVSFTVDPKTDTPQRLKMYGDHYEANYNRWNFLTGNKREIYELGVQGFKVSADEDPLAPGGFLHSEKFVLVDQKGHPRGYYDGTNVNAINDLIGDIKLLVSEETRKRKRDERNDN